MKARHKYSIGEVVYDKHQDEFVAVMQKRVENGHLCYRLSNEGIRHENFLIPLIMETPEQYTDITKHTALTIEEVKDQVAKKNGFINWLDVQKVWKDRVLVKPIIHESYLDQAVELCISPLSPQSLKQKRKRSVS